MCKDARAVKARWGPCLAIAWSVGLPLLILKRPPARVPEKQGSSSDDSSKAGQLAGRIRLASAILSIAHAIAVNSACLCADQAGEPVRRNQEVQ